MKCHNSRSDPDPSKVNIKKAGIVRAKAALLLFFGLFFLNGCITAGDGLINSTDGNVNVRVYLKTGQTIERQLMPHEGVAERRTGVDDISRTYESIIAYDHYGRKLGQFTVNQIPSDYARQYGRYITFIITEDGVFPVPKRFLDSPEKHIPDIMTYDDAVVKKH